MLLFPVSDEACASAVGAEVVENQVEGASSAEVLEEEREEKAVVAVMGRSCPHAASCSGPRCCKMTSGPSASVVVAAEVALI